MIEQHQSQTENSIQGTNANKPILYKNKFVLLGDVFVGKTSIAYR